MQTHIILWVVLFPAAAQAAEPVYRSQDAQGRVIYSTEPPAGAVHSKELKLPPPAPDEEVQRAGERARKEKELAERLERERKERAAEAERRRKETEPTLIIERRNHPVPLIVPNPVTQPAPDAQAPDSVPPTAPTNR